MEELFEMLGAFYGWCGLEIMGYIEYVWLLLYWPVSGHNSMCKRVLSRRPLVILAGYMSNNRGRLWNRRRE